MMYYMDAFILEAVATAEVLGRVILLQVYSPEYVRHVMLFHLDVYNFVLVQFYSRTCPEVGAAIPIPTCAAF